METFPSGNDCCRVSKIGHGGIKNSCFMLFLHWVKWWSRAGRSLEWPNWDCLIKNWDIWGYHISFVGSSFFRNLPYVSPEMCRKSINPIPVWKKNSPKKPWSFWGTEFTQMTGTINHAGVPFCWDGDFTANHSRKSHRWLLEYSGKLILVHIYWAKAEYLGVPDFDPHPTCLKVGLAFFVSLFATQWTVPFDWSNTVRPSNLKLCWATAISDMAFWLSTWSDCSRSPLLRWARQAGLQW